MSKPIIPFIHSLSEMAAEAWMRALKAAMPGLRIALLAELSNEERERTEVAIVVNPDPRDLAVLPNLQWVQSLWAGVERLLAGMPDPSVRIARLIDPHLAETMAEAVLAWTLYLHRDMQRYAAQQRVAEWHQHDLLTAAERRVSILGLGQLGQAAAARLHDNNFDVRGWSRSPKAIEGIQIFCGDLSPLLEETDILVILLPSTNNTRGLLNGEALDRLPHGAQIINFARADIIDTPALLDRLASGQIDHAVLDVFAHEPLPSDDPLWRDPAVTVLPHTSAPTNRTSAARVVATNLQGWFDDATMPATVSKRDGY